MARTPKQQLLRRVKVYLLGESWIDNGTGYCFGEIDDDRTPYLIVRNEQDQKEVLLRSKIEGSIQFQRQQDTLIVWTDLNGHNIALSFQETEGCLSLCDFIIKCHRGKFAPNISLVSVISNDVDGDITELITGPLSFPPLEPNANDLIFISNCFNEHPNSSFHKQTMSDFIQTNDYIPKLIKIFNQSEEQKQIKNLHILCNIIKSLILYNEGLIIELILDDEYIMGVIGILEYDPEFPQFKSNHRVFLKDDSKFKEILPVNNERVKNLIKKTFKLQFLKDVVLARLLDDPTFNLISTLIHFNQVEIIAFLEKGTFIDELFALYQDDHDKDNDVEETEEVKIRKRDGIKLLHQFVLIAKSLQPHQKTSFFKSLIKKGLFKTINFVMKDNSVEIRVIGTELIVTIIEHDVLLINGALDDEDENEFDEEEREYDDYDDDYYNDDKIGEISTSSNGGNDDEKDNITSKEDEDGPDGNPTFFNGDDYAQDEEIPPIVTYRHKKIVLSEDMTLFFILTHFLLEDNDPGLKIQAFEALKSLLDLKSLLESLKNGSNSQFDDSISERLDTTKFSNAFYEKVAPILFQPLVNLQDKDYDLSQKNADDSYTYLCELINFCSKDKSVSRSFFLENHIISGITELIKPGHKLQLRLAAVRSIKSIISLNDDYYTRYIISNNILSEVFKLFDETNGVSNLTNSTILDLIEIVIMGIDKLEKRQNVKLLARYIVQNFKSSLETIDYVSSGKDLIRLVEIDVDSSTSNGNEDSTTSIPRNETTTGELVINDENEIGHDYLKSVQYEEILREKQVNNGPGNKKFKTTPEKRNREEDHDIAPGIKKKNMNSLRKKFSNAGKKFASKLKKSD